MSRITYYVVPINIMYHTSCAPASLVLALLVFVVHTCVHSSTSELHHSAWYIRRLREHAGVCKINTRPRGWDHNAVFAPARPKFKVKKKAVYFARQLFIFVNIDIWGKGV